MSNFFPQCHIFNKTNQTLFKIRIFLGDWASKFDKEETTRDNFYLTRDQITMTKFMKQKGNFNYYTSEELRAHVLQLPYQGEDISMVIILPPFEKDSLYTTVNRMTPEAIQRVMAEIKSGFYEAADLTVMLPKFKIEQSLELSTTLGKLGLESFFGESDFSQFLEDGASDNVKFDKAVHKSFIEVNEEGSEAAAATALFGFRSARPLFNNFIANHPFLFLIYDSKSDRILFFGVYQDPRKSA